MDDKTARQIVMQPQRVELWRLGGAIDRDGPSFAGAVSARLVADILELDAAENWPRSSRDAEVPTELFRPMATMPKDDGKMNRTFLPEDLAAGDESTLRAFAEASKNPFVMARVYEVLWDRFKKYSDAKQAIDARLASTALTDPEADWPEMVRNLGRLTTLVLRLNATERLDDVLDVLAPAAEKLISCSRPFAFPVLADMVCNTLLTKKHGRALFGEDRKRNWEQKLEDLAARYKGDAHHGHNALLVLQAWRARWGDAEEADAAKRAIVDNLREAARAAEPSVAASLAQQALQAALDFGVADLAETTRSELADAIRATVPTFREVSGSFTLPAKAVQTVSNIVEGCPTRAAAVRQLALLPGLLEVDTDALRGQAREQLKESPFYALVPKVRYDPDGKITHKAGTPEETEDWHVASLVGFHLATVDALLTHFLRQAFEGFTRGTLLDALADWPHLAPPRRVLLAVSSERFSAQDWVSAGCIAATVYEALLRDLLRAGNYAALKNEPGGVLRDEMLGSLICSDAARSVLGADHCALVEYALCDSALGWNLRNDVAHGTIRPEHLSPARVLFVWLLIVRLTCFTARKSSPSQEDSGPEGSSQADSD